MTDPRICSKNVDRCGAERCAAPDTSVTVFNDLFHDWGLHDRGLHHVLLDNGGLDDWHDRCLYHGRLDPPRRPGPFHHDGPAAARARPHSEDKGCRYQQDNDQNDRIHGDFSFLCNAKRVARRRRMPA